MLRFRTRHRDLYANLLQESRSFERAQIQARDRWLASLEAEHKHEALFELEVLLKGIACFGNPRNHPGAPRRTPGIAHNYRTDLEVIGQTLTRATGVVRQLLGERDRAYSFGRYLESLLPEDSDRSQLLRDQLVQDTPLDALWVLRSAFTAFIEIIDGLRRLEQIPNRLYHGVHATVTREIGRNTYFNPMLTLEFRPELDRIEVSEVVAALQTVPSEAGHRLTALTFLTLFRALRYLALVERYAADPTTAALTHVVFSVFRSDLRILTRFLTMTAAESMAEGLEREIMLVDAHLLREHYDAYLSDADLLIALRQMLRSMGGSLRVEVRRILERELPSIDEALEPRLLAPQVTTAVTQLRAAIEYWIRTLCRELLPEGEAPTLTESASARVAGAEHVRRELWMIGRVLRAFLDKAAQRRPEPDQWGNLATFDFVHEFLRYFRLIGFPLIRLGGYERREALLQALEELRQIHYLHPERRARAYEECERFHRFTEARFGEVSRLPELRGARFDRKTAIETLRMYLGS